MIERRQALRSMVVSYLIVKSFQSIDQLFSECMFSGDSTPFKSRLEEFSTFCAVMKVKI